MKQVKNVFSLTIVHNQKVIDCNLKTRKVIISCDVIFDAKASWNRDEEKLRKASRFH